jgi:hypothetical protein
MESIIFYRLLSFCDADTILILKIENIFAMRTENLERYNKFLRNGKNFTETVSKTFSKTTIYTYNI